MRSILASDRWGYLDATSFAGVAKLARRQRHRCRSRSAAALHDMRIDRLVPEVEQNLPKDSEGTAAIALPPLERWGDAPELMSCCEAGDAPLRVAVLVSGGVDSSVALQLVASAGHQPTAFYLQIWFQEDFRNFWDACPWEEDLGYARQVCAALDVPLEVVPLTQQYWDRVVADSVSEIKAGRTPNPDMLCNSRVKFGAFLDYLQQHYPGRFDRVASGHYARLLRPGQTLPGTTSSSPGGGITTSSSGSAALDDCRLALTPDAVKDQTYFLAGLDQQQLATCMFPLGAFTKPQVRALAAAAGLATQRRADSQGICFLGRVKFSEFVAQHLGTWPGPLLDAEGGAVLGLHDGHWFYTPGQRGGIKLPAGPWYVVSKDATRNVVAVSRAYYEPNARRDAFVAGPVSWLSAARPLPGRALVVKVRHGPNTHDCDVLLGSEADAAAWLTTDCSASSAGDGMTLGQQQQQQQQGDAQYVRVQLAGNDQGLAAGQFAVFYQDGICLGAAPMLGAPSMA